MSVKFFPARRCRDTSMPCSRAQAAAMRVKLWPLHVFRASPLHPCRAASGRSAKSVRPSSSITGLSLDTDETFDTFPNPSDPTQWPLAVLHYLGSLQESLVAALDA